MTEIAVNGYPLYFDKNGINRYLKSILLNIHSSDIKITLFVPYGLKVKDFNTKIKIVNVGPNRKYFGIIWNQIIFPYYLLRRNIRVIWSPTHRISILLILLRFKIIITIHDLVSQYFPKTMKMGSYILDKVGLYLSVNYGNAFIVVSNRVKEELNLIYKIPLERISVTELGCDLQNINSTRYHRSSKKEYILNVGTLEPRKNIKILIEAYSLLPDYLKDKYNLMIIGNEGWGNINVNLLTEKHGISDKVELYESVNDNQLSFLYKNAKVSIYPSMYEGFGLPILESISLGVPVIVSNLPPMNQIAPKSTYPVDTNSVDCIRNSLTLLLSENVILDSLKKYCLEEASKYDWKKSASKTVDVIRINSIS